MAMGSTLYNFNISLSDTMRNIYEELPIRAARHSSETLEYLVCRVLAYCIEYSEGLEFSKGLENPDLPAIWKHDLTGAITDWIEIGTPSAAKLHKASKTGAKVSIYTHKNPELTLEIVKKEKIHRRKDIVINSLNSEFIELTAAQTERRNEVEITINEGTIYLKIRDLDLETQMISFANFY